MVASSIGVKLGPFAASITHAGSGSGFGQVSALGGTADDFDAQPATSATLNTIAQLISFLLLTSHLYQRVGVGQRHIGGAACLFGSDPAEYLPGNP